MKKQLFPRKISKVSRLRSRDFLDPSTQSDLHGQYGGLKVVLVDEDVADIFARLQNMTPLSIAFSVIS